MLEHSSVLTLSCYIFLLAQVLLLMRCKTYHVFQFRLRQILVKFEMYFS